MTKDEIVKRLTDAKQRAVDSGAPYALAQVSECFLEVSAILAEQDARIDRLFNSAPLPDRLGD